MLKPLALIFLFALLSGCADKSILTHKSLSTIDPVTDVLVRARHIGGFNADSMLTALESIRVRIPDLTVEHQAALAIVSGISQNQKGWYHLAVRDLERARKIMPPSAPDSLVAIMHTGLGHANKNRGEYPSAQQQMAQQHELRLAMGKIEQQNEWQNQRLAISRDLLDNIGAQLTFIISSVDNLKYRFDVGDTLLGQKLSGITNFARDTIVELCDTIWAMNNSSLGFDDLRGRILNFVEKARESHESINFQVYIDSSLEEARMSSVTGMKVYRCIQEAVNNALKHSGATSINIDVERDDNLVSVIITDNGSGYDASASRGNGLINLAKRMSEIDGALAILTNESGTQVTLYIPNDKIIFAA